MVLKCVFQSCPGGEHRSPRLGGRRERGGHSVEPGMVIREFPGRGVTGTVM